MEQIENNGQRGKRQPMRLYRVRCGKKTWSPWLPDLTDAWWRAHRLKLARYDHKRAIFFPGPLTWIEIGERAYAGRRTVSLRKDENGQPLPSINLPTMPLN